MTFIPTEQTRAEGNNIELKFTSGKISGVEVKKFKRGRSKFEIKSLTLEYVGFNFQYILVSGYNREAYIILCRTCGVVVDRGGSWRDCGGIVGGTVGWARGDREEDAEGRAGIVGAGSMGTRRTVGRTRGIVGRTSQWGIGGDHGETAGGRGRRRHAVPRAVVPFEKSILVRRPQGPQGPLLKMNNHCNFQ